MAGPWLYDLSLLIDGGTIYQISGNSNLTFGSIGSIIISENGEGPWLYDLSLQITGSASYYITGNSNMVFNSLGIISISPAIFITGNGNIIFNSSGSISISTSNIKNIIGEGYIIFDSSGILGFIAKEINIEGFGRNIFDSSGFLSILRRLSTFGGLVIFSGAGRIYLGNLYYSYKISHTIFPYIKFEIYNENDRPLNCDLFNLQIKGYSKTGKLLIDDISSNENTSLLWTSQNTGKGIYFFTNVETVDYTQLEYELVLI